MERIGINTLAAHGEDLFGSEGAKASIRAELRLDLKLNKDAWKALSGQEKEDWAHSNADFLTHALSHGVQALTATGIAEKKSGPYLHRDSLSFVYRIYGPHRN